MKKVHKISMELDRLIQLSENERERFYKAAANEVLRWCETNDVEFGNVKYLPSTKIDIFITVVKKEK